MQLFLRIDNLTWTVQGALSLKETHPFSPFYFWFYTSFGVKIRAPGSNTFPGAHRFKQYLRSPNKMMCFLHERSWNKNNCLWYVSYLFCWGEGSLVHSGPCVSIHFLVWDFVCWKPTSRDPRNNKKTTPTTTKTHKKKKEQTLEDMYSLLQTRWIFQLAMLVYEN